MSFSFHRDQFLSLFNQPWQKESLAQKGSSHWFWFPILAALPHCLNILYAQYAGEWIEMTRRCEVHSIKYSFILKAEICCSTTAGQHWFVSLFSFGWSQKDIHYLIAQTQPCTLTWAWTGPNVVWVLSGGAKDAKRPLEIQRFVCNLGEKLWFPLPCPSK